MSNKKKYIPPDPPLRDPDHVSKRGVNYYFSPDWVRGTNSNNTKFGRIKAVKKNGIVSLYMESKEGNLSYIHGSIQREFVEWHERRKIDYFFLATDADELDNIILST